MCILASSRVPLVGLVMEELVVELGVGVHVRVRVFHVVRIGPDAMANMMMMMMMVVVKDYYRYNQYQYYYSRMVIVEGGML